MNIVISKSNVSFSFMQWLKRRIRLEAMAKVEKINFSTLEQYIKDNFDIDVDIYSLMLNCVNNIVIKDVGNDYILSINENQKYKNTQVFISTLVKLVDSGNFDIKGYNILTSVFNNIKANIKKYYLLYNPRAIF